LLAENMPLAEVMRSLGVSHQTYQRWRSQYAAMRPDDVARLTTLEKENARLKRLLAEKELDNDMFRARQGKMVTESKASGRFAPRGRIRGFEAERVWWSTNTSYCDPVSLWQNGRIESFNSRLRDEILTLEILLHVGDSFHAGRAPQELEL
jgi:transposase-like protein